MKLSKICKYLDNIKIKYNRYLRRTKSIEEIDEYISKCRYEGQVNLLCRIDEKNKNTIRLTFQNIDQNIIFTNVFKNQEEVLEVLKIQDNILVIDKNFMKKIK